MMAVCSRSHHCLCHSAISIRPKSCSAGEKGVKSPRSALSQGAPLSVVFCRIMLQRGRRKGKTTTLKRAVWWAPLAPICRLHPVHFQLPSLSLSSPPPHILLSMRSARPLMVSATWRASPGADCASRSAVRCCDASRCRQVARAAHLGRRATRIGGDLSKSPQQRPDTTHSRRRDSCQLLRKWAIF